MEKDIVVEPADDESTTSSDSESTTDKEIEPEHVPEEEESPDINIPVKANDDESTTSSDKESTADDEDGPEETSEISTVETIVVEKTHSQVSTTITEITTKNAPNYPTEDILPAMEDSPITDNAPINAEEVPTTEEIPIAEDVQKTESEVPESAPVMEECEGLVYEISPAEQFQETDKPHVTPILTNERESQTEDRDVYNEMTQTDYTTEITRGTTKDAFSMTPTR